MRLPRTAEWIAARLAGRDDAESLAADLQVEFEDRWRRHGGSLARRWLWRELSRSAPSLFGRQVKSAARHSRKGFSMWHRGIVTDLHHVLRRLRRSPGFTALAVGMLGIGLGATTAIFALAYTIWLKPLPYKDPGRLVSIYSVQDVSGFQSASSGAEMMDVRRSVSSFAGVAGYHYAAVFGRFDDGAVRITAYPVSTNLFEVLGVSAALGRTFRVDDEGLPLIVLSDAFWRSRFHGAADILGRTIKVDGEPLMIVGVMPREFRFPLQLEADAWTPGIRSTDDRATRLTQLVARLAPGASTARANIELKVLSGSLARTLPATNAKWTLQAEPVAGQPSPTYQAAFGVLLGMVGLFLVIACANLANLFVARNLARRVELTLALAIGAPRWRLARAVLLESGVIAAMGVGVAVLFTSQATTVFALWMPPGTPRLGDLGVNGVVLAFALVAAMVTTLLCALAPIAGLRSLRLAETLSGMRGASAASHRGQHALVVVEIALAAVLLIGGTAMVRSFSELLRRDRGYVPSGVMTLTVMLAFDNARYEAAPVRAKAIDEILTSVAGVPGVTAVGAATGFPGSSMGILGAGPVNAAGRTDPPVIAPLHNATPDYFKAMGVPLREGRTFSAVDGIGSPRVCVISETLERQLWPNGHAVGQRFNTPPAMGLAAGSTEAEVIGVVADMHLANRRTSDIFVPFAQVPSYWVDLVVRTPGDPTAITVPIRQAIHRTNPDVLLENVSPLQTIISNVYGLQRAQSFLTALVATLGGLIAMLGLYALLNQYVARRTRELGICLALGSSPGRLFWQVFGRGMRLSCSGIGIGLVVALVVLRIWRDRVFGLQAANPWFLAVIGVAIAAVCAAVIATSARRVTSIDPIRSIRQA
jgi:predicted permease